MKQDSTKPTLAQFKDACRHEFSFLRELGLRLSLPPPNNRLQPTALRAAAEPERRYS